METERKHTQILQVLAKPVREICLLYTSPGRAGAIATSQCADEADEGVGLWKRVYLRPRYGGKNRPYAVYAGVAKRQKILSSHGRRKGAAGEKKTGRNSCLFRKRKPDVETSIHIFCGNGPLHLFCQVSGDCKTKSGGL